MSASRFNERRQVLLAATATPGVPSVVAANIKELSLAPGRYRLTTDGVVALDTKVPDVGSFPLAWDDEEEWDWPGGTLFAANLTGSLCTLYITPMSPDVVEPVRR